MQKTKLTIEEIIRRSSEVHDNKYEIPIQQYTNAHTPILIICPVHGEFQQTVANHVMAGKGCRKCAHQKLADERKSSYQQWVDKCKIVHGNLYDYPLDQIYKNNRSCMTIICKTHQEFQQTAVNHMVGNGCTRCGIIKNANLLRSSFEQWVQKAKSIHNNRYIYPEQQYINSIQKMKIICPDHGEFQQTAMKHLSGQQCPQCINKTEGILCNFLQQYQCSRQKTFPDLKYINLLRFDFAIIANDIQIIIECDGPQHFQQIKRFGGEKSFKTQQIKDNLKNEYCISNKIPLIRIYQGDIWDDKNDWKTKLLQAIDNASNGIGPVIQKIGDIYNQ